MIKSQWTALVARYPADCQPIGPVEDLGNAGGLSGCQLWRFPALRGTLALRRWPSDGPALPRLIRVHHWLAHLRTLSLIPCPITSREGTTLQADTGALYQLEPWLPGVAVRLDPTQAHIEQASIGLARAHAALAQFATTGTSPGLARRLRECAHFLQTEQHFLSETLEPPNPGTERDLALGCLELIARRAPAIAVELRAAATRPVQLQPCLRDARPEHFLFEGTRLTGIVDTGAMDVESPAADLARLLGEWLEAGESALHRAALDAYERVQPLGAATSSLIGVFERSAALLGPLRWIRWHFVERRTFEVPGIVARSLERGLARLRSAEW